MAERPILFSGEMVRAILEGRKTQTRRIVKPQPFAEEGGCWSVGTRPPSGYANESTMRSMLPLYCPYGQPGDRLWVRETWVPVTHGGYEALEKRREAQQWQCQIVYAADKASGYHEVWDSYKGFWRPSIFMPRWASRITLEVLAVRVERLQDISEQDCIAEGITYTDRGARHWYAARPGYSADKESFFHSAQNAYKNLWESINGSGSWEKNPWVWVIDFKRVEQ